MTTQIPNSMLVSPNGVTGVTRVAGTPAIPLDLTGNGRGMPLVAGQTISITADYTPTIAAGVVLDGVCVADYLSSGVGNLLLTNYNARGDTFAAEAGRMFSVTYFKRATGAFAIVQKGDIAPVAPTFSAQSAPAGTVGTAYAYTFAAVSATSYALFSGAIPAGLTLNLATGALTGTPTTAATSAFVISATNAVGTTNSTAQSVVIGVAATAPGQVTALNAGTATNTTQPLMWTAPASNGGSVLTDYLIEYKLAAAGTYTTFTHTASTATTIVVTGLTALQSYNYRISAINSIGTGLASVVLTNSTSATAVLSYTTFVPAAAVNLTTVGTTDWGWAVQPALFRRMLGSSMTRTMFGGGTQFSGTSPTYTISNGEGSGFNAADTSSGSSGINMDASPGGHQFTASIGTTQRTVDVYFVVSGGTATVTLTLSDGSATLAPFSAVAGSYGLRILALAGIAAQTLTIRIEGTTIAGVANITASALTQA